MLGWWVFLPNGAQRKTSLPLMFCVFKLEYFGRSWNYWLFSILIEVFFMCFQSVNFLGESVSQWGQALVFVQKHNFWTWIHAGTMSKIMSWWGESLLTVIMSVVCVFFRRRSQPAHRRDMWRGWTAPRPAERSIRGEDFLVTENYLFCPLSKSSFFFTSFLRFPVFRQAP